MKHLLGIEHLNRDELDLLISNAMGMVEISTRELKKVPALRGKTVVNLFYEASTRTRTSFEIAGKRLSADVINISTTTSSVTKGESLLDTARTLESMAPDVLVVRHSSSGAPHFLASHLEHTSVINAGDGMHEHPTQALLDCVTLLQHFQPHGRTLEGLRVAIVGDVRHSRVARSSVWAHLLLGNEVRLIGPATLLPDEFGMPSTFAKAESKSRCVPSLFHTLKEGLAGVDVVMCLRMQLERQEHHFVPSLEEYSQQYCISERILQEVAPQAVVLHPGPINRGIEVSSEVVDGPRSLVQRQVNNGVAVRMGVLFSLASQRGEAPEQ